MSYENNPNLIIILVAGLLIFWYYNDKNSKNLEHRKRPFKGAYGRKEFLLSDPVNLEKTVEELLERIDELEEENDDLETKIGALHSSEATSKEMIKYLNTNLNSHIDRTSH